jgi:hypothetical protein
MVLNLSFSPATSHIEAKVYEKCVRILLEVLNQAPKGHTAPIENQEPQICRKTDKLAPEVLPLVPADHSSCQIGR